MSEEKVLSPNFRGDVNPSGLCPDCKKLPVIVSQPEKCIRGSCREKNIDDLWDLISRRDKKIGELLHDLEMVKNNRDGMQNRIRAIEIELERIRPQRDRYNQELLAAKTDLAHWKRKFYDREKFFSVEKYETIIAELRAEIESLKKDSRPTTPDA